MTIRRHQHKKAPKRHRNPLPCSGLVRSAAVLSALILFASGSLADDGFQYKLTESGLQIKAGDLTKTVEVYGKKGRTLHQRREVLAVHYAAGIGEHMVGVLYLEAHRAYMFRPLFEIRRSERAEPPLVGRDVTGGGTHGRISHHAPPLHRVGAPWHHPPAPARHRQTRPADLP